MDIAVYTKHFDEPDGGRHGGFLVVDEYGNVSGGAECCGCYFDGLDIEDLRRAVGLYDYFQETGENPMYKEDASGRSDTSGG
jgi:hypothetical protein